MPTVNRAEIKQHKSQRLHYPNMNEGRKIQLNYMFEEIHRRVSIDHHQDEIKDIKTAVRTMLGRVVDRVNGRGLFKGSRIEPCGGMREDTTVLKYENNCIKERYLEFDYLGALECSVDIEVHDKGYGDCFGLRKPPMNENALRRFQNNYSKGKYMNDKGWCDLLFWREINMCLGSACDCFEVQIDDADNFFWSLQYKFGDECPSNYRCDKCVIDMPTGTLRVNDSEIVGRERFEQKCSLAFRWTSKVNTVIISM